MSFGKLYSITNGRYSPINEESMNITGDFFGIYSSFEIQLLYKNRGSAPLSCTYIYPIDTKLLLYSTTFTLDGKKIDLRITRREEGEEIFQEARKKGHTAFIHNYISKTLSELSIGNIPPKSECLVTMKFCLSCNFPTPDLIEMKVPLNSVELTGLSSPFSSTVLEHSTFTIANRSPISLSSISSQQTGNFTDNVYTVPSLTSADCIIVKCHLSAPTCSFGLRGLNYGTLMIRPHFEGTGEASHSFVFAVDCSGSMAGKRIKQARLCLSFFIKSLPLNSRFDIIRFGSTAKPLFGNLVEYSEESAKKAKILYENMGASLGGTDILPVLTRVTEYECDYVSVFLITDGEVYNTEEVINFGHAHSDKMRVFTLGVGSGADAGLVNGLADQTNGTSAFIDDPQEITFTVISQLRASLSPMLRDYSVSLDGVSNPHITPFPLPPLISDFSSFLFVNAENNLGDSALVSCESFDIEAKIYDTDSIDVLRALFAKSEIDRLLYQPQSNEVKQRITELSLESGVLSPYTCFVGYSENAVDDPIPPITPGSLGILDLEGYTKSMSKGGIFSGFFSGIASLFSFSKKSKIDTEEDEIAQAYIDSMNIYPPKHVPHPHHHGSTLAYSPKPEKKDTLGMLGDLIGLQCIDGSWASVEAVMSALCLKSTNVSEVVEASAQVLATLLALSLLRSLFGDQKAAWSLIERKALDFIQGQLSGADVESLIGKVSFERSE